MTVTMGQSDSESTWGDVSQGQALSGHSLCCLAALRSPTGNRDLFAVRL